FSSRRRHTRSDRDWSSDVCSSDLFAAMLSEGATAVPAAVTWSPEAEVRIARIPDFIQPMARRAIERYAEAKGLATITEGVMDEADRKSTRLNSSHDQISYAVFCLKKKKNRS